MQNTQAINVTAGNATATGSVTVSDNMPAIPCPDPAGYKYVGARYVPLFSDPLEWDINSTYEPLTIVLYEGNSYTSRQYVPIGIQIDNEEFWALTGNYNAQVEQYRQEVIQYKKDTDEKFDSFMPLDTTPVKNSVKAITSGGVYDAMCSIRAEHYGITTSNTGDQNSALIQAALKDCISKDAFLTFGVGTYNFSHSIDLMQNAKMQGVSSTFSILKFSSNTGITGEGERDQFGNYTAFGGTIRNFKVVGPLTDEDLKTQDPTANPYYAGFYISGMGLVMENLVSHRFQVGFNIIGGSSTEQYPEYYGLSEMNNRNNLSVLECYQGVRLTCPDATYGNITVGRCTAGNIIKNCYIDYLHVWGIGNFTDLYNTHVSRLYFDSYNAIYWKTGKSYRWLTGYQFHIDDLYMYGFNPAAWPDPENTPVSPIYIKQIDTEKAGEAYSVYIGNMTVSNYSPLPEITTSALNDGKIAFLVSANQVPTIVNHCHIASCFTSGKFVDNGLLGIVNFYTFNQDCDIKYIQKYNNRYYTYYKTEPILTQNA